MTLNQFLDAAYALLVDEYRRLGSSLVEALDRTREYAAGYGKAMITASGNDQEAVTATSTSQLTAEELANEQAMAAFEQALAGIDLR